MSPSSLYGSFVLLCVVSLALWWHDLVATFGLALQNDAYTHILLVIPISTALIFAEWRQRKAKPEPNFRAGLPLLILAILARFIGGSWWGADRLTADEQLSLGMSAFVTWWIGSFVGCFGARIFRMSAFPLCFLLWLVPFPKFVLDHIVNFLQHGSAYAARLLFVIARVPVTQDGVRLSVPGLTIEVAKECSSIRSSLMLLVTSMVLVHLWLRSAWSKALIVTAAIVLSIAKNGFRVFVLSMLGIYVDPSFLHGWLHHHGGVVFFVLSLACLFALLRLGGWAELRAIAQPAVTNSMRPIAVTKATPKRFL
jgi:exosortase